jgi:hypothetical protein
MRSCSARLVRFATRGSVAAQANTAASEGESPRSLATFRRASSAMIAGRGAARVGALQRIGEKFGFVLPFHQQRLHEVAAVLEMPVEAALGHAESAGQHLDAHAAGAALQERETGGAQPVLLRAELCHHTVAYGSRSIPVVSIR